MFKSTAKLSVKSVANLYSQMTHQNCKSKFCLFKHGTQNKISYQTTHLVVSASPGKKM